MRKCPKCHIYRIDKVVYRIQKNDSKHLAGFCTKCGWSYLAYEEDLDIPTVEKNEKLKSKKNKWYKKRRDKTQSLITEQDRLI
jgi:hypothetical protein